MKLSSYIVSDKKGALPIHLVNAGKYNAWLKARPAHWQSWLKSNQFDASAGNAITIPDKTGKISATLCITADNMDIWAIAHLPAKLPPATYKLANKHKGELATQLTLGWALGCYEFDAYKTKTGRYAKLVAPDNADVPYVKSTADATAWARDLINAAPNEMNTAKLAQEAISWGKKSGATIKVIKGKELLKQNYPLIYAVGKASDSPPHLIDLQFGKKAAPKITLVGKGVCFDSGGLDIKSSAGMRLMKKDMGGAAATLALAKTLVDAKLPIRLRVLLPIVENSVASNAMRPSDVSKSRSGKTVEIGNTDAEGRLILCDALTEADREKPEIIIDCATLTGAARIALGTDIPAFFSDDDALAKDIEAASQQTHDPVWRLPLHAPYLSLMESDVADISNNASSGYGGAITAALYLKEFVTNTASWVHVDMMAWNVTPRPGRPKGGEAMGVRALYNVIKARYGK